jgi:RNA polymerase sigma factor (sigma-70 family)
MKSSQDGTVGYSLMSEEDQRFQQFLEDDWGSIGPILYLRTKRALRKRRYRGVLGGPVPGGHEVEDFIHQAVREAYRHLPKWDGQRESLLEFLWARVVRIVKRYAERAEAGREVRTTTNRAEVNAHVADVSKAVQDCYQGPEDFASDREEIEHILKRSFSPLDREIIEVIIREELSTPEEIAERLGISVSEVNNAKKRLRRDPYLLCLKRQWVKKKRKRGSKKRKGGGAKSP